jgi:hypothetical protein
MRLVSNDAVVLTSYTTNCDRPSVQDVLMVLHENPGTSIVEGLRWRGDDRSDLHSMEERIKQGLVRGMKLYPGYDAYAIADPLWGRCFGWPQSTTCR